MIYFIEHDGMVKIGYSSRPNKRLQSLKTSNPGELIMRLIIEGTIEDEKKYHHMFKEYYHRGEWYLFSDEIKKFINDNEKIDLRYDFGLINNYAEIKCQTGRLRNLFGLTLAKMGSLLNMTAQSIKETETREINGTISINRLKKYAGALNYKLIYKFVKQDSDEFNED